MFLLYEPAAYLSRESVWRAGPLSVSVWNWAGYSPLGSLLTNKGQFWKWIRMQFPENIYVHVWCIIMQSFHTSQVSSVRSCFSNTAWFIAPITTLEQLCQKNTAWWVGRPRYPSHGNQPAVGNHSTFGCVIASTSLGGRAPKALLFCLLVGMYRAGCPSWLTISVSNSLAFWSQDRSYPQHQWVPPRITWCLLSILTPSMPLNYSQN